MVTVAVPRKVDSCVPSSLRFNYRSTHYMAMNGYYKFLNWFDDRAWYPLGRIVGGTVRHTSQGTVEVCSSQHPLLVDAHPVVLASTLC